MVLYSTMLDVILILYNMMLVQSSKMLGQEASSL